MSASTLDVGPVRASGALRAYRGRVVFVPDDEGDLGTLYVIAAANNIKSVRTKHPIAGKTKRGAPAWEAELENGRHVYWTREGCATCGFTLKRLSLQDIISNAKPAVIPAMKEARV